MKLTWARCRRITQGRLQVRQPVSIPIKEQKACDTTASRDDSDESENEEQEENGGLVDTVADKYHGARETFAKKMQCHVELIRNFCDSMEHQIQFGDHRFLKTLERESAGFLRLAENCITQERRLNSSRETSPTTWENSAANAMFYHSRP
jgi:hypothetical protein